MLTNFSPHNFTEDYGFMNLLFPLRPSHFTLTAVCGISSLIYSCLAAWSCLHSILCGSWLKPHCSQTFQSFNQSLPGGQKLCLEAAIKSKARAKLSMLGCHRSSKQVYFPICSPIRGSVHYSVALSS